MLESKESRTEFGASSNIDTIKLSCHPARKLTLPRAGMSIHGLADDGCSVASKPRSGDGGTDGNGEFPKAASAKGPRSGNDGTGGNGGNGGFPKVARAKGPMSGNSGTGGNGGTTTASGVKP